MACLNINSLTAHIDELRVFMNTTNKIDILAINETKLDSLIQNEEVHLSNFELIRRDRPSNGRNGGGVCFYIRNNITFQVREDLQSDYLECLTIQVTKPRSKPFLVSTWYRPPHSSPDLFSSFEEIIAKIDVENYDFYLLSDLNVNLLPGAIDRNSSHLHNIIDIYGLNQMINEPTRVTETSKTLIDLCLTNCPEKISKSGVIHLGISDHSLIFATRKISYTKSGVHKTVEARQLKNFNNEQFLHDLKLINWDVSCYTNPNEMWHAWKNNLMTVIDKHAPVKSKRIRNKNSPWITKDLISKMHKRD